MSNMAGHLRHGKIKGVLAAMPRGSPFGLSDLLASGVSRQLAAHYVSSGWLQRLGQGVYTLAGDQMIRERAVRYLQQRVDGLHVAGKSALALHGLSHYLLKNEVLVLWGDRRFELPTWFTARFPSRYVFAHLFEWPDLNLPERSVNTPPGVADGLRVSVPERAMLELLHEVGGRESLDEVRNLFEGLRNLRKDVVGELLSCCRSVKAVRLFLTLSRETGAIDVDELRQRYPLRVGSNTRWMNRQPDGTLLTLKPYG